MQVLSDETSWVRLYTTLAIPVVPGLSLGATATLRYGVLDIDYRKGRSGTVPYAMTSTQNTDGFGVGFDVGMLWSPAGWTSMGAVARFPYTLSKVGETRTEQSLANFSAETGTAVRERYPFRVSGGAAFRLGERGIVALQANWLDWSAYRRTIHYDSPVPGVFENSEGNPGEWRDAWVYAAGYELWLSDRWALRCGVAYDQTPDPPPKETDFALLCEIIRENLDSKEFFINKAIGWSLRQYARTDPRAVKKFVKATPLQPLSRREAMKHLEE